MVEEPQSAAQQAAAAQACGFAQAVHEHRLRVQALSHSRSGVAMAMGWQVSAETLDAEFDLDEPLLARWLEGGAARVRGRLATSSLASFRAPWLRGTSPFERRLRLGRALALPMSNPRDTGLARATGLSVGLWQGGGERSGGRLADAVHALGEGSANGVRIAAGVELVNSAPGWQAPRLRMHVSGLPAVMIRAQVAATGGPVTQWRFNAAGLATTRMPGMTAQQLRNTAVLTAGQRAPGMACLACRGRRGGVLTVASRAAVDGVHAIEADLRGRRRIFDAREFAIAAVRGSAGDLPVPPATGDPAVIAVLVGNAAAAAPLPVVLFWLGEGIVAQVV